MPVLLSTGDTANRNDITLENGLTEDLSSERSEMSQFIVVTDDNVQLQVSVSAWFFFVSVLLVFLFVRVGRGGGVGRGPVAVTLL